MLDIASARLRTHRNNIARYRRLLETKLTELEREYIQRRLSEEQSDLEALGSVESAFNLQCPKIATAY
jgi:predicted house-cleaning noncanonical NTP pyrophosphatase (MazG superfamily)